MYDLKDFEIRNGVLIRYKGEGGEVTIPDGVKEIGGYYDDSKEKLWCGAFHECKHVTAVRIPSSVKKIREYAFLDCKRLKSVNIPFGVKRIENYTFSGCTKLASITIPDGVREIGEFAFCECSSLLRVEIPESVIKIGENAFGDCYRMRSITLPSGLVKIESALLSGCSALLSVSLPEKIEKIGDFAFLDCSALKTAKLPSALKKIGLWAFRGCESLASVEIPASVTCIENSFPYCASLASIVVNGENPMYYSAGNCLIERAGKTVIAGSDNSVIPDDGSVTRISTGAFSGRCGLVSVCIPSSVTEIEPGAFDFCPSLASIEVQEGNPVYRSFQNCLIKTAKKELILGCKTSVIPNDKSVTSIGSGAFLGCVGLHSMILPDAVTKIDAFAFSECTGLESVVLPEKLKKIGREAFCGSGLVSVDLPARLMKIEGGAFSSCKSLEAVKIPSSVREIDMSAFMSCEALRDLYFSGSRDDWSYVMKKNARISRKVKIHFGCD